MRRAALAIVLLGAACDGGGTGGAGGGGSGGGGGSQPVVQAECAVDADCEVLDDCCTCGGVPVGTMGCEEQCFQPACASQNVQPAAALCRAGRCVLDLDCNQTHATCGLVPTDCPVGQTATVTGDCYDGGCSVNSECREVTSCADCTGDDCASVAGMPQTFHCLGLADACGGAVICACLPDTCGGACTDTTTGIDCG